MTKAEAIRWGKIILVILAIIIAIALISYLAGFWQGSDLKKLVGRGIWTSVIP
jgi:hypothetical protein